MSQKPEEIIERSEREILRDIMRLAPKVTDYYEKEGGEEQRLAFLADNEIRATNHSYPLLAAGGFGEKIDELMRIREEIAANPGINEKFLSHYLSLVDENVHKYTMLKLVQQYHATADEEQKKDIRQEYLTINGELYGAPERSTFDSVVKDLYVRLENIDMIGEAADIRTELFTLLKKPEGAKERFRPSADTVQWLHQIVDTLYGGLLQHVPAPSEEEIVSEQARLFKPAEIKEVFETIIREEFGEAAADWKVVFVSSGPIEVDRIKKQINIPEDHKPVARDTLRGLVVHELGVHFLRGVMGYEMNNPLHALGFRGYRLLEEGAGVANQQALTGKYKDSGDSYYLVASLMELEGKDKRDTFEVMWRYFALRNSKDGDVMNAAKIDAARNSAYRCIDRMTKGMDDMPSNMDLSYYLGSDLAWQYYERNCGDPDAVTRFFMSRLNTADMAELGLALDAQQMIESPAQ